MKRYEAEMRHEIGIDKLMWGADYPHLEGAAPVHRETLRYIFGGMPEDDLRRILGAQRRRPVGLRRRPAPGGGRPGRADRRRPGRAAGAGRHRGHVQLEPGPAGAAVGRPLTGYAPALPERFRRHPRQRLCPKNGRRAPALCARKLAARDV